jgi:hypothetical protein
MSEYSPLTGENWDREAAGKAWFESMDRARHERTAPHRWVLHGRPGVWVWRFFNFGAWTGRVEVLADGFHWRTESYDTGQLIHHGVTTSLYVAYQSVERNAPQQVPS